MADKYNLGTVGATFKELYSGDTLNKLNATATLNDSIENYKILLVECSMYDSSNNLNSVYINIYVPDIVYKTKNYTYNVSINGYNRLIFFYFDDATTIKISAYDVSSVNARINKIIGVVL